MAKTRRQYSGGAVATTVTSSVAASGVSSFAIASSTGWPSSAGVPFYIVLSPQTSAEEKMLVTISGTTLTVVSRGVDGTSASSHASGATIYPVITAVDLDEANELTAKYASRGSIVYQGATTFEELAKGTEGLVLKAGANDPAWGQIATAGIADDAITTAKIAANAVGVDELATAVINKLVPVGTIAMYGGASAPTGWLLCDGTAINGSYTALIAIVGANTPDLKGRFAIGDNSTLTLLGTGGSATIAETNLPSHTHTFSATSGSSTTGISLSTTGSHAHGINGELVQAQDVFDSGTVNVIDGDGYGLDTYSENTATTGDHTHSVTDSGHTHTVSGTTGNGSGSGTDYYQPYLVVNYIIKHD